MNKKYAFLLLTTLITTAGCSLFGMETTTKKTLTDGHLHKVVSHVPDEVIIEILSFLKPKELLKTIKLVNNYFHQLVDRTLDLHNPNVFRNEEFSNIDSSEYRRISTKISKLSNLKNVENIFKTHGKRICILELHGINLTTVPLKDYLLYAPLLKEELWGAY